VNAITITAVLLVTVSALNQQSAVQPHVIPESSVRVTLCDMFKDPQQYAGKLVEFRAAVIGTKLQDMWLEEAQSLPGGCDAYMRIVAAFPAEVTPNPPFVFQRDATFDEFRSAIPTMRVYATFTGRFDPVFVWRDQKRIRIAEGNGYGKKHNYDGRVVLLRITDVLARHIPRM